MNKKICIQEDKMKYYILILLLFIVIVFYLFYQYTYNKMNEENKESQSLLKSKLDDLENNIKSNNVENYNIVN